MNYSRFLAAEIRFINYMIHQIGGAKVKAVPNFPKLEGLAEQDVLKKVESKLKTDFSKRYAKLKLKEVRSCLRSRGCFLFE